MADVHARPFDTAAVRDDGRTVNVDFTSGVEPCVVLDHVDVSYGADAVTITLFEGHDPSAGEVACIAIGVFKRTIVTLDQPLDGRDRRRRDRRGSTRLRAQPTQISVRPTSRNPSRS
jgi:hypothetical protein